MFFWQRKKTVFEIEELELEAELKEQLKEASALIAQVEGDVKKTVGLDLTCRLQLRDDCDFLERVIEKFCTGRDNDKLRESLANGIIRLRTTSGNILYRG